MLSSIALTLLFSVLSFPWLAVSKDSWSSAVVVVLVWLWNLCSFTLEFWSCLNITGFFSWSLRTRRKSCESWGQRRRITGPRRLFWGPLDVTVAVFMKGVESVAIRFGIHRVSWRFWTGGCSQSGVRLTSLSRVLRSRSSKLLVLSFELWKYIFEICYQVTSESLCQ